MNFLNEQVILELGGKFNEWRKELVLTHHIFGDIPHFWLAEKHIYQNTRCPFICDCIIFHRISGDISIFDISIEYKKYPIFYDLILIPIIQQYCYENLIEMNIIKRNNYE